MELTISPTGDQKKWLRTLGYSPGTSPGIDAQFMAAVAAFQADWGFAPTGTVDPDTAWALEQAYVLAIEQGRGDGTGRRLGALLAAGGVLFGLGATGLVLWAVSNKKE